MHEIRTAWGDLLIDCREERNEAIERAARAANSMCDALKVERDGELIALVVPNRG